MIIKMRILDQYQTRLPGQASEVFFIAALYPEKDEL